MGKHPQYQMSKALYFCPNLYPGRPIPYGLFSHNLVGGDHLWTAGQLNSVFHKVERIVIFVPSTALGAFVVEHLEQSWRPLFPRNQLGNWQTHPIDKNSPHSPGWGQRRVERTQGRPHRLGSNQTTCLPVFSYFSQIIIHLIFLHSSDNREHGTPPWKIPSYQ